MLNVDRIKYIIIAVRIFEFFFFYFVFLLIEKKYI